MRRLPRVILFLSAAMPFASQCAHAAEEAVDKQGLSPAAIEQIVMINRLIDLGDARKDPLLLIAAAKLQKSLGETSVAPTAESRSAQNVLDRAAAMAQGRKDLLGLAEDVRAMKSKGVCVSQEDCFSQFGGGEGIFY